MINILGSSTFNGTENYCSANKKILSSKLPQLNIFLHIRNGEIVGRIAAIKNDIHLKYHNDASGQFGFFECINDQQCC
ncbi:MAG: hypothetical protein MZV64_04310 [Ignavibacteriales bacterium]|nr:hypothetical protein [Ignavibacteriales bacterium]